jgi:hypothetical protein
MEGQPVRSREVLRAPHPATGRAGAGRTWAGQPSRGRRIRRLSPSEIASYDLVPPAIARRAVLVRVPVLPPGAVGLTSGRFVLLLHDEPTDGSSDLIAHELVHVRQFAETGRLRFASRYLGAYLRNLLRYRRHRLAYLHIPAEQEAYGLSHQWFTARNPAG